MVISQDEQREINEIEVKEPRVVVCQEDKLCCPEAFFEMIEQCKLCGRCL